VRAGAAALARRPRAPHARTPDVVLIHDVARPLVRSERIEAVALAARASGAALLAVPVRDTIKRSRDGRAAESTLDRSELWAARTPQAFAAERLHAMLERAAAEGLRATDDAALHERYFGPVALVEDAFDNWKLTTREDLALAEAWLAREDAQR
jgi:2-C-methyl-D-erythritol 4-phosphate cytidylyltransferase